MKKLLITTIVIFLNTISQASIEDNTQTVNTIKLNTEELTEYSLIVKFKDKEIHKSLLSTPETEIMLKNAIRLKSSYSTISKLANKYNVSESSSKEYGQIRMNLLSEQNNIKLSHTRSLALNADLIKVNNIKGKSVEDVIDALVSSGHIEYAVLNTEVQAFSFNDQHYNEHQKYFKINSEELPFASGFEYSRNMTVNNFGRKVRVAIIDSGILPSVEIIPYSEGYDFISSNGHIRDDDPTDYNKDILGRECSNQHGTAVTSVLMATANNGIGMVGAVDDNEIEHIQARALNCKGSGQISDILDAVAWVSGLSVLGVPDISSKVDFVNLSLGGKTEIGCDPHSQDIYNAAREAGVTVVIAAGNDNHDASFTTPASCNNVITVGSLDETGDKSYFSNYGKHVDISAVGVNIVRVYNYDYDFNKPEKTGQVYRKSAGTSFTSPLVMGSAINIKMNHPYLTPDQLEAILKSSTLDKETDLCNTLGCGEGHLMSNISIESLSNVTNISTYKKEHKYEGYNDGYQITWLNEVNKYKDVCGLIRYSWGNLGAEINNVTYKLYLKNGLDEFDYFETTSIPQKIYNTDVLGVSACNGYNCGNIIEIKGDIHLPKFCL